MAKAESSGVCVLTGFYLLFAAALGDAVGITVDTAGMPMLCALPMTLPAHAASAGGSASVDARKINGAVRLLSPSQDTLFLLHTLSTWQ